MNIKVCGITKPEQLEELDFLGVDYAGMIFYAQSARYVLDKMTSGVVKQLNLNIKKVGVFVNEAEDHVRSMIDQYELDLVQLHGDETPAYCKRISNAVSVIKAFRINEKNDQNIDWMIKPFEEYVDLYLFDAHIKGLYGGTGEKFNWKTLETSKINKNFFLSGGIGLEDLPSVVAFKHPFLYGVDLNSKLESSPGIKDMEKVKLITQSIRSAYGSVENSNI